jgi:hypothetical protein
MATMTVLFRGFWQVSGESIAFTDHVLPRLTLKHRVHCGTCYAKSVSDAAPGHSSPRHSPGKADGFWRHFGVVMSDANNFLVAPFRHFVVAVILRGAGKKVVGVHTRGRVAAVQNQMAVRDGTDVVRVAHSVSKPDFTVKPVLAVTANIGRCPKPTAVIGFVDFGPESFFKHGRESACMTHDSQGSVPHF